MKKVAIVLVLVGVMVFLKMRNQGDDSSQILSEIREVISELDEYDANGDYLDQILETRHDRAFREAYDMGGRRRSATFNEEKYITDLFTLMVRDCNRDNKRDLAVVLAELRDGMLAVMAAEAEEDAEGG